MNWLRKIFFKRRYKLLGAIDLLCLVHTDDEFRCISGVGFRVNMGAVPDPWIPDDKYVDAWRTLRREVGRQVD